MSWEKYTGDQWISIPLKDIIRGDIIRKEGKCYVALADAEYWELDECWAVMADPYLGDLCGVNEYDTK